MQPSGGSTPLPASPLPPSPYQQTYNPETGITFAPSSAPAGSAPASPPRKGPPKAVGVIFVVVIVVVAMAAAGVFDGLFGSSSSNPPTVQVTNTSASHVCPYGGAPTETYRFTLVNGGSVDANAQIGFYLNDAEVHSGTYPAPSGTSTPYVETVVLGSCPPSGSTYYLDLVSVNAL